MVPIVDLARAKCLDMISFLTLLLCFTLIQCFEISDVLENLVTEVQNEGKHTKSFISDQYQTYYLKNDVAKQILMNRFIFMEYLSMQTDLNFENFFILQKYTENIDMKYSVYIIVTCMLFFGLLKYINGIVEDYGYKI